MCGPCSIYFLCTCSHFALQCLHPCAPRFAVLCPFVAIGMSSSKFGPPSQKGDLVDMGKMKKLAQRVEETLTQQCLFAEPKQLDPSLILVAPLNRLGAPPNKRHVHFGILKSFKTKGFDRSRAAIGICIKFTSPQGLKALHEHNQRFSKGCQLLPAVKDGAIYGSLACSHYNISLRLLQAGAYSPIGNLTELLEENEHLKDAAMSGHKWWILPEEILQDRQVDISLWRNMDQNENQATHEMEILQGIKATAVGFSVKQSKITQGDLLSAAQRRNPVKLSLKTMQVLTKVYIGFLENGVPELVQELVDFHSEKVDPKELTVSTAWVEILVSEEALLKCPHTCVALWQCHYTLDKVRSQSSGPSVAAFLEPANLLSLCRKTDLLKTIETQIRDLRAKYLPILEEALGDRQARLELAVYLDLIIRCLFSKPWPLLDPKVTLPVGKFSQEKIWDLGVVWSKYLDCKHKDLKFGETSDLREEPEEDKEDTKEVSLEGIRHLKKVGSEGPEPDLGPKFSRGDEVTIVRRVSWVIPQKGKPKFRKDLVEGTQGVVQGWGDLEQRLVLLTVVLDLPDGKKKEITKEIYPRNLKLTSEYQLEQGAQQEEPSSSSGNQGGPGVPAWALLKSDPASVKVISSFKGLQADKDKNAKLFQLKGRIAVSLQALGEVLPSYSDKDFNLVARQNDKGIWISELWTNRPFEAMEIQLGPWSSQLKDSHLMASLHALVGLPKNGPGAHPDNQAMALDGRGKSKIAPKGALDSEEHHGSLFWVVSRTSTAADANLVLENISFETQVKVSLPAPKRRKTETCLWDSSMMPSVPILVNKTKIQKHKQLLVFQPEKKKDKAGN